MVRSGPLCTLACTNYDTDQTCRHCPWVRHGAILHSERPDTLDQVDIVSRPGKVTVCPANTIFIDKGAKEGEAHCLNRYANGPLEFFFLKFSSSNIFFFYFYADINSKNEDNLTCAS